MDNSQMSINAQNLMSNREWKLKKNLPIFAASIWSTTSSSKTTNCFFPSRSYLTLFFWRGGGWEGEKGKKNKFRKDWTITTGYSQWIKLTDSNRRRQAYSLLLQLRTWKVPVFPCEFWTWSAYPLFSALTNIFFFLSAVHTIGVYAFCINRYLKNDRKYNKWRME